MKYIYRNYAKCILLGIFVLTWAVACQCARGDDDTVQAHELIMSTSKTNLKGNDKTTDLTFSIPHGSAVVDLDDFSLSMTVHDADGTEHLIHYPNKDGAINRGKHFHHDLTELSKASILNADNDSFTIPIILMPEAGAENMKVQFHLRTHVNGEPQTIKTIVLNWQHEEKLANLLLTCLTPLSLNGSDQGIRILVDNKSSIPAEASQVKLKITRLVGNTAVVVGSTLLNHNTYTLDMPTIQGDSNSIRELIIDPKSDNTVNFNLQLQYNGQDMGSSILVQWQRAGLLKLENIVYNSHTGKITCSIKNDGFYPLNDVVLSCKTAAGKKIAAIQMGALSSGEERTEVEVGVLDATYSGTKLQFDLTYIEKGVTKKLEPISYKISKSKIDVGIYASYNVHTSQVEVLVQNKGNETVKDLILHYQNISQNGKNATLHGQSIAFVNINPLEIGSAAKLPLNLDFNGNSVARFSFKLKRNNEELAQIEETFTSLPVELTLTALSPKKDYKSGMLSLYGSESEISIQIKSGSYASYIDRKYVKLLITNEDGFKGSNISGYFSTHVGGEAVHEIAGGKLGEWGSIIKLYLKPTPKQQEAKFKLQLTYHDHPMGEPTIVRWKEYKLFIEATDQLVGNQTAIFNILGGTGYIDLSQLTVWIKSNNTANFQLLGLDGKGKGYMCRLDEMINPNLDELKVGMAQGGKFKLSQANEQKTAEVTIIVKRGNVQLAEKKLTWKAKESGKSIDLSLANYAPLDTHSIQVTLKNTSVSSKILALKNLKMRVRNTSDVPAVIGNDSGINIEQKLDVISGISRLEPQVETNLKLSLARPLGLKVAALVTLEILDAKKDALLQKKSLVFINSIILQRGKRFKDLPELSVGGFETETYAGVNSLLTDLFQVIKNHRALVQQLNNFIIQDAGLTSLLMPIIAVYQADIEQFEKLAIQLGKVAQSLKGEQTVKNWGSNTEHVIEQTKILMGKGEERVAALEGIALTKFLAADYDLKIPSESLSIRASYNRYRQNLRSIATFCDRSGDTTPRGDLPVIKHKMETELVGIKSQAQHIFNVAFVKLKADMAQGFKGRIDVLSKNADLDEMYIQFEACDQLLNEWQKLAKTAPDELGIPAADLADFLADQYQNLAAAIDQLAEDYTKRKQLGSSQKCMMFLLKIKQQMTEIVNNHSSIVTNAAYEAVLKQLEKASKRTKRLTKSDVLLNTKTNSLQKMPKVSERLKDAAEVNDPVTKVKEEKRLLEEERKKNLKRNFTVGSSRKK